MDFISVRRSGKREANRRMFEAALKLGRSVVFAGNDGARLYEKARHGVVTVTPMSRTEKPVTVWWDDIFRFGSY